MTPLALKEELGKIVDAGIMDPVMIIGESGIGKTSIVGQVNHERNKQVWDVRWGTIAPVDARGAPVPDKELKITEFYPPKFWPRDGEGVIFLDEFNMASTVMMGLAQQLLMDRRFGDYVVPDGIRVWAAGNRKVDRSPVNEIPAPVNNRCAHYDVEHDFQSWEIYAFAVGIDSRIIGHLKFMPDHLHKFDPDKRAWPSPRTWEMANRRLGAGMSVDPVIGDDAAATFEAHLKLLDQLPNLALIPLGNGRHVEFPEEPSLQYATVSNLEVASSKGTEAFRHCLRWFVERCKDQPEWVQMFVMDVLWIMGKNQPKLVAKYYGAMESMPEVERYVDAHVSRGIRT